MRPVRIAIAVVLTATAAASGIYFARSTAHQSATPDRGGAAPAPPTTVAVGPGQNHPSPAPQPPGPTTTLPLGRVEALEAVQAVGTQIGFAVGKGTILSTRDGGRTWVRVWRGAQDLHSVDFVSASTGWAVGDGALLGTVDGGQHWRQLGQPRVGPLRRVHFSSRSDGWVASGTRVWRSTDGGRSWGARPSFAPPLREFTFEPSAELECAAPSAAWVRFNSNEGAAGSSPYALYATGDGGAHWRCVLASCGEPGMPGGPGSYPGPFSVIDPLRAFMLGPTPAADSTGAVLISQGGSQVQRLPGIPRARLATDSEPISVSFGSATHGWIVGAVGAYSPGRGVILATVDGGRSWHSQLGT